MIESSDIDLIEATQQIFDDNGSVVAAAFYARLFDLAPDLRPMFSDDMAEQHRKLSATLVVAISSLRNWEALGPTLSALARRHVGYGVAPWHYAVVTQALLDTLTSGGVDDATVAAWNRGMSGISSHMIASAYGEHGSAGVAASA